ncbi:YigZ family protein [Sulfurimonas sp. SAG-AH-194-I05]|nr:YigZ family protein [Sulfurimonas sp. SAG-AH-194-I05]MDF1876042.1 YigZ family protein [Sulfurimonas sp. SAG-AH-194-I05]
MQFVNAHATQTLEIKHSKFIAHVVPYDLYEATLQELKNSHPKARHFVTAFRYFNKYKQIVEHSSDDGEPKGTSGKPTLIVLQGANIINSAIITVRYFGGTKLGTGGLVRAYSDAANLVLESLTLQEYKYEITKIISFSYNTIRKVEYECQVHSIQIISKEFTDKSVYTIKADEKSIQNFLLKLDRLISI